ncbi:MAG: DMT family transporter [Janthinobacterium lividum]
MKNSPLPAIFYMLAATLLFALVNVGIKNLEHIPAVEIILFRSVISLALTLGMLRYAQIAPWGHAPQRPDLVWRGVAGTAALVLGFLTIKAMPLAPAVTLQYLGPIFTAVAGIWLLGQPVKPWQWVFFAISLGGVVLSQGVGGLGWVGTLLGLGTAATSGLSYVFSSRIGQKEHPLVVIFYFQLITLPVAAGWCFFDWRTPAGTQWLWLAAVGVFTQAALWCVTQSYQRGKQAAGIAALDYLGILYAGAFGYWFFGEKIKTLGFIGMGLVLVGVALNGWYTAKKAE